MTANPTMLRRQVAAELRRLREGTHRTVVQAARELGWSESKLSRIETGASGVRDVDLERLLAMYSVPEPDRSRLVARVVQSRQRSWWEVYGDTLPDAYTAYIGFEAEASAILTYQPLVAFGLLQTAEYTSALMHASEFLDGADGIAQRITARLARQAVLTREPSPRLHVILDEAALRRPVGGPNVMRRQMLRLIEASDRPQTVIQVLPLSIGAHSGLAGSFVLLEFPDRVDPPVVYSDSLTGGLLRSKPEELRHYYKCFDALRSAALTEDGSRDVLFALSQGEDARIDSDGL